MKTAGGHPHLRLPMAWRPFVIRYCKFLSESVMLVKINRHLSEESKVKLWHRVSLLSDLKKRGASRVAHFLHSIFKEQAPPQSGEGSLLRWFWSFTGAS